MGILEFAEPIIVICTETARAPQRFIAKRWD